VDIIENGGWAPGKYTHTKVNPDIESPLLFTPFMADPNDDKIIYMAGAKDLLRCDNITAIPLDRSQHPKPQYWSVISSAPSYVTAIGISTEPANMLYYGTRNGQIYRLDNADKSPEITDVYYRKGLPIGSYVSNIDVDPHNADHVPFEPDPSPRL